MNGVYKLLGVDDSEDDLFLLRRSLRHTPSLVLSATLQDGAEAISYLRGDGTFANREEWPLPDVMVLDLKMPKVDGFGVLAWLAERPPFPCRVAVLTSSLSESDRLRALQLGADAVYIKPASPEEYRVMATDLETKLSEWKPQS